MTNCAGGQNQSRWTGPGGFDTGWSPSPLAGAVVGAADADIQLDVRCSLSPSCVSSDRVTIKPRNGRFSFSGPVRTDDCVGHFVLVGAGSPTGDCSGTMEFRFVVGGAPLTCFLDDALTVPRPSDASGWGSDTTCEIAQIAGSNDVRIEMRCSNDPACTLDAGTRTVVSQSGAPVGTRLGTLRVRKSAGGCSAGGNVLMSWQDTDFTPLSFAWQRADEPTFAAPSTTPVADFLATDPGVECDGGGAPYRGRGVYFYVFHRTNACTGQIILPDP